MGTGVRKWGRCSAMLSCLTIIRVSLMVGTPAQWIDVFVSTASQETWVVGPGGCDGSESPSISFDASMNWPVVTLFESLNVDSRSWTDKSSVAVTCQDKRGGLFKPNESTTWDNLGFYGLG